MSCETWKPLLAGYLDGELTPDESERLKSHLSHCSECRDELTEMRELEGVTEAMKREIDTLPDVFWDRYWLSIYNRTERGLGWLFFTFGATLLIGFGLWHLATNLWLDASAPLVVRIGTASLAAGFSLMLMSLVRERIRTWRHDPYKEVASERPWSCSSRPRSWRSARR